MSVKTLHQIQQEGLDLLVEKLGPDDAIRFLQIYEPGRGDWTEDRKKYLDKDPDKILTRIMERRKKYPFLKLIFQFLTQLLLHLYSSKSRCTPHSANGLSDIYSIGKSTR
jgi:hypothetical protein